MRKLRMGIIGAGMALEKLHYPAYQELQDKFQIAAICDVDEQKAKNWGKTLGLSDTDIYTDYEEIINRKDLDAFDVMVPVDLNYQVMEAVAKKGKPMINEKPLAPTRQQAEAARELPKKYNVPILIAENYRYNEEINIIRDLVRTQDIGTVYYFMQNRVLNFPEDMLKDKFPAKEWRQYPDFPGGALLDTGVHDIAALHHIFGPIDKLQAFGRTQAEDFAPYSVIQANMQFKSGVIGQFSFFCTGKEMQRPLIGLRIFGTKGMIYLEERDCGTVNVAYNDGTSKQLPYRVQRGYYNELLNFYKAAIGEEALAVPPKLEFGDAMTIWDIMESVKTGKTISVDAEEDFPYGEIAGMHYHNEEQPFQH